MKRLCDIRLLPESTLVGAVIAVMNIPYLQQAGIPRIGLTSAVLGSVSLVMWQAHRAWSSPFIRERIYDNGRTFGSRAIAAFYAPIFLIQIFFIDPWLAREIPGFRPADIREIVVSIPWVMLFQPLFLVAAQYAFSFRITGRHSMSMLIVVLLNQLLTMTKSWDFSGAVLAATVILSGVQSLFMVKVYQRSGFIGPALLSGLIYARFLCI